MGSDGGAVQAPAMPPSPEAPDRGEKGAVAGEITKIVESERKAADGGLVGSILVEDIRHTQFSKAVIGIRIGTAIYRQEAGGRVTADFSSLKVGQRVRVVLTGPVAFSHPAKAQAREILILQSAP